MKRFEFFVLALTRRCSLRCRYCSYWKREKEERDISFWVKVLEKFKDDIEEVCIVGGEPLLYNQFWDLMREIKRMGLRIGVASNGLFLDGESLMREEVDIFSLSFDGFREEHFLDEYSKIKSLRAKELIKFGAGKRKLIAGTTVNKKNLRYIPEIVGWLSEWGIPVTLNLVQRDKSRADTMLGSDGEWCFSEEDSEQLREVAEELKKDKYLLATPKYWLDRWSDLGWRQDWKCLGDRGVFFVDCDGVMKCCYLYDGEELSKLDILRDEREEIYRARAKDVERCSGCFLDCALTAWAEKQFGGVIIK